MTLQALAPDILPAGIRSRFVEGVNGLRMHVLEAGHDAPSAGLVVLLHGFPELAYSWRGIMPGLAAAGYHVVAPDLRGYGRTTGADTGYDADLEPFDLLNQVRDILALTAALGRRAMALLAGHDFGSILAAACALARPDIFRTLALMSAPFGGAPPWPGSAPPEPDIQAALAQLSPPRKHYHWYYSTRAADADMRDCPQGLHRFLRAYYHHKSADWAGNRPVPLAAWSAAALAALPAYYVMPAEATMAQAVADSDPPEQHAWLPDAALAVYTAEYGRTGFQGGLQSYRCRTTERTARSMALFAGRTIDVPSCFIAGRADWGVYQRPGDFEKMQTVACTHMDSVQLLDGGGHWIQQEQPERVLRHLLDFLQAHRNAVDGAGHP